MDKRGIYRKFDVRRLDGKSAKGRKHAGCRYFVLDLDHDPHAFAALKEYANSCEQDRPKLSEDLVTCLMAHRKGLMAPLFEKIMLDEEKQANTGG